MVKKCSLCKLELPLESFSKHLKGYRPRCKNCIKIGCSSPDVKYSAYKSDAKRRGHYWKLTKNKFKELWESNCYYCNDAHTFGIDRLDNNLGYIDDNVVSCCSNCNYAKGEMSIDAFLSMISKIYKNHMMET